MYNHSWPEPGQLVHLCTPIANTLSAAKGICTVIVWRTVELGDWLRRYIGAAPPSVRVR